MIYNMFRYFRHGTSCAGVAAADKNTLCVIGTAYGATLAGTFIVPLLFKNINLKLNGGFDNDDHNDHH